LGGGQVLVVRHYKRIKRGDICRTKMISVDGGNAMLYVQTLKLIILSCDIKYAKQQRIIGFIAPIEIII